MPSAKRSAELTLELDDFVNYLGKRCTVAGIDECGYLTLRNEDGDTYYPHKSCSDIDTSSTIFYRACSRALSSPLPLDPEDCP